MNNEPTPIPYNEDLVEYQGEVYPAGDFDEPEIVITGEEREELRNSQAEQDLASQPQAVKDAYYHAMLVAKEGEVICGNCNKPGCRGCGRG